MDNIDMFSFLPGHMVRMQPNPVVDDELSEKTRGFLYNVGLRNSNEFDFAFTGETLLLPDQVVIFK